jgi:hypothetical protein
MLRIIAMLSVVLLIGILSLTPAYADRHGGGDAGGGDLGGCGDHAPDGGFTGATGEAFPDGANAFGDHGTSAGFTFGSFSEKDGSGLFHEGGATGGAFSSFAGFSFAGESGGPGGSSGDDGPAHEISELGVYGDFGVFGEQLEGGAVGNFAHQDKSGNILDVSGFGKDFGEFFSRPDSALAALGKV